MKMNKLTKIALLATAAVALAPMGALAGTLTITASVNGSCTIGNGTLALGNFTTLSPGPIVPSSSITVTCTAGTSTYALSDSSCASSSCPRNLTDGSADEFPYQLYTDVGAAVVLGTGAGGTGTIAGVLTSGSGTSTVYGQANPAGVGLPASGAYSASVTTLVATVVS